MSTLQPPTPVVLTSADGARAEVARHGAHVLAWRPAGDDRDRLFLSATSEHRRGAAIRGGIPVIFPQFAATGPYPRHGFARTSEWELVGTTEGDGDARATFRLVDSPATRAVWPHRFATELTVTVGGATLDVTLAVANPGEAPFTFTGALHTYLRVRDVTRASLRGLRGVRYRDGAAGGGERTESEERVAIRGEVDRVYLDAPAVVELWEDGAPTLEARMAGFRDVVVWNPGAERGAALADLEPGGFARMLCVEAAVVGAPVTVAPGARWTGSQTLVAR